MRSTVWLAIAGIILGVSQVHAQERAFLVYFGGGTSFESDEMVADGTPISFGIASAASNGGTIVGFDFGREGEMLDSTFGGDSFRMATSYNLLVGGNLYSGTSVRADAMLLIGARETFADCPDSFLGFQCYADAEPDVEYDLNLGAVVMTTFDGMGLGVRVTQQSAQAVVGFRF